MNYGSGSRGRVYVAGGSSERLTVVRPAMERLKSIDYSISYDWTKGEEWGAGGDDKLSKQERLRHATLDLDGVARAHYFWFMVPEESTRGAWVELGYALARCELLPYPSLIVSGPNVNKSIFTELAYMKFDSHEEAFQKFWVHTAYLGD